LNSGNAFVEVAADSILKASTNGAFFNTKGQNLDLWGQSNNTAASMTVVEQDAILFHFSKAEANQ
jgi:hypothetical protein